MPGVARRRVVYLGCGRKVTVTAVEQRSCAFGPWYNAADPLTAEGTTMSAIRGTIQDGQVILNAPANLPNGTEVRVEVVGASEYVGVGMREEDWPTTPEGITDLVAKMDRIQPFLTPEEEAEWQKARAE